MNAAAAHPTWSPLSRPRIVRGSLTRTVVAVELIDDGEDYCEAELELAHGAPEKGCVDGYALIGLEMRFAENAESARAWLRDNAAHLASEAV